MRISDWSSDVCSSDLLWKEQNYRCIYTDASISPMDLLTDAVQVDHVLPRSRSQDNGYQNRVLCFAKANQDKKQRTPWEWQGRTDRVWRSAERRVGKECVSTC